MAVEQTGWEDDTDLKPLTVPEHFASGFQIQTSGNNFALMLQRLRPLVDDAGIVHHSKNELFAAVWMSPQTAKDLSYVLQDAIRAHESEHGAIKTAMSKARIKG